MYENQEEQIKKIEKELQDTKNEMDRFFNLVPTLICTASKDGYFKKINLEFEKVLGYSKKELLSVSFFDLIHPDDIAPTLNKIEKWFDHNVKLQFANRYRCKDGSYKFLEWEFSLSSDGIYYATARDITERKLADEILNPYMHVVTSSEDMIAFVDRQYTFVVVNPAYSEAFKLTPEDFIGKTVASVFGEELFNNVIKPLIDHCLSGEEFKHENWHNYPAYGRIYIETTHYPYRNKDNDIMGCVVNVRNITAQKEFQNALIESEQRYRLLNESAGVAIGYYTPEGAVISFNPIALKNMNGKPEDFVGKSIYDIFPRVEADIYFDRIRKAAESASPLEYEDKIDLNSGSKWFQSILTCVQDSKNRVIGVQILSVDITDRKLAEYALKTSETHLKKILDTSPFPTAVSDKNADKIMYWSQSAIKLFGYNPKTTQEWYELAYPDPDYRHDVINRWIPFIKKAQDAEGAIWTGEYSIVCKNGTVKICEIFVQFIPENLIVTMNDITDRKQSELALAAEKERLAVTLRSIGDGVITTDTKGHVVMLNKVAEKLTGWNSNEAIGHPLPEVFNIINENTREQCENPVEKVLATGGIIELENHTCLIAKDGRKIVIADSGAPIRNNESQIIGVVLVFRDMTEKQKLEEAFQNSQKLESLGLLAGGIAHDFNNILGAIFGYTELAMMKSKEEKVSSFLAKSLSNIERARALTEQLLTFAIGGAPIKNVEDLFPFVEETTQFALSGSSVSSRFEIQENLWACDFDRNKIGQVIDNLIINAQQAMPMGGTILVSAINISLSENEHNTLPGGNYVKLSIKDQGIGIPKEFLTNIFDPYYTTKPNGHGLGLATCFSIINRHDGCLEVESEHGQGSTFHIYLPAAINSVATSTSQAMIKHKRSGTFLVMDDEETNREIMKELLESFGYTVVLKENGQKAVDFFMEETKANRKLAGMIFDLTIPGGMGGKEAIGEIRKMDSDTPAFVASGYSADPVMANPEEYGFSASICKPFMMDELSKMLENHMKKA